VIPKMFGGTHGGCVQWLDSILYALQFWTHKTLRIYVKSAP